MDKKPFVIILVIILITFSITLALRYFQPKGFSVIVSEAFPLQKEDWIGEKDDLQPYVVEILSPDYSYIATYKRDREIEVQLFFDYFSAGNRKGGIHSPLNCLPGSGWTVSSASSTLIPVGERTISATRLHLKLGEDRYVMDYWYITRHGETSSDYLLKVYTMISSLTFRPGDMAFVRFVARDNTPGLEALQEFEETFVGEIYSHLPFDGAHGQQMSPNCPVP